MLLERYLSTWSGTQDAVMVIQLARWRGGARDGKLNRRDEGGLNCRIAEMRTRRDSQAIKRSVAAGNSTTTWVPHPLCPCRFTFPFSLWDVLNPGPQVSAGSAVVVLHLPCPCPH